MSVTMLESRRTEVVPRPVGEGSQVTVRPIEPSDQQGLRDFYRDLSADARHTRFLGTSPGIDDQMAHRYATARDREADGYVAILRDLGPADGSIVGHLCLEPLPDGSAEVAVAVADAHRHQGIGTALMAAAMASARERGIPRLVATMFAGNEPMRQLFLGGGGRLLLDQIRAGVEAMAVDPRLSELNRA